MDSKEKKTNSDSAPSEAPATPEHVVVSWNAPEFVYTHKPIGWYLGLIIFFALLIAAAIFTRQWISIGVFAVMGITVAIYANRKPRMLTYSVTDRGVHVGDKKYEYINFGGFFEADDYGQKVFELVPLKRFAPLVSLSAAAEYVAQIEQSLAAVLPKEPPRTNVADQFFKFLRF